MQLVVGRECGECTVCCKVSPIATTELTKGPNTPCPNCTANGCAIYDYRPSACRESFCGWRAYAELDNTWRPDISGVLILNEPEPPPPWVGQMGLKFLLVDGDGPLTQAGFIAYVSALVSRNIPVSLAVQGPPDHWPVKTFINVALQSAMGRGASAAARALQEQAAMLRTGRFERADV